MNNFNFIAPIYDTLSKLVFGKSLIESQTLFLSEIKDSDTVLILGGGTGKLLEALPKCQKIDFVDLSERMINRAKKRDCKSPNNFIQADFLMHDFESTYDVIICPFFLDCFEEQRLFQIIGKCRKLLTVEGSLVVTDFNQEANQVLLKLMHLFFRITANLESTMLMNIQEVIERSGFNKIQSERFKKQIFTTIYRKGE